MFVFDVIENIDTVYVGFLEDGVQTHFVVVQLARLDHEVLHDCMQRLVLRVGG